MKQVFLILIALFLVTSCSKDSNAVDVDALIEEGHLGKMKKGKDQLKAQADSLNRLITQLNVAIDKIDTVERIQLVKLKNISTGRFEHYIDIQGNIETSQDVGVSAEYPGVLRLNVREGQYVGRGALIGSVSDGGLTQQLRQAEVQRDLARTTYQKQSNLWKQKIGSEMQFLQAKTNFEAAQKGVDAIKEQLRKTRIYAPFSGVVEDVMIQSGQAVSPGMPILRLVNTGAVKAVANVPEVYLSQVKRGTKVIMFLPALSDTIDGSVSLVSGSVNPSNRTFKIEVPVSSKGGMVKPNLNVKMKINDYNSDGAIVIKEDLVKQDAAGNHFVWIAFKNKKGKYEAQKRNVKLGKKSNAQVEVAAGLQEGDQIILEGGSRIKEGDILKISK